MICVNIAIGHVQSEYRPLLTLIKPMHGTSPALLQTEWSYSLQICNQSTCLFNKYTNHLSWLGLPIAVAVI